MAKKTTRLNVVNFKHGEALYARIREPIIAARRSVACGVDIAQTASGQLEDHAGMAGAVPFQIVQTSSGLSTSLFSYFDRYVRTKAENATIGIVLCKEKNEALVEITLPQKANIHAKKYQLYLPGKDELKRKLIEWAKECDT